MSRSDRARRSPSSAPVADTNAGPRFRSALPPDEVQRLLPGGAPIVLQSLGLVNPDGSATADAHRKLKQISHLVRLLEPGLQDVFDRHPEPALVDFGAGRSALSLVMTHTWTQRHSRGMVHAVEQRADFLHRATTAARSAGLERFAPVESSILDAPLPERLHFVFALHACDTATDHALARGIAAGADYIAVVPCCQAELGRQLAVLPAGNTLHPLWKHAWHRREFGAHLTNVLRALVLQACGYQVTVTELAGWEHAVKNELILARRVARFHRPARLEIEALLAQMPITPWLLANTPWQGAAPSPGGDESTAAPDPTPASD